MIDVFSEQSCSTSVKPIHIFVLCNVLRRPIIVLCQHVPSAPALTDDVCGIYLPVLHPPADCCRSPLVVVYACGQFVPLVPRAEQPGLDAGGLLTEPGVPLWRADAGEPLVVRCLVSGECAEQALTTYLRVVELPHTSATSTALYPVAKYDVIAPDIEVLDEFLAPATTTQPGLMPVGKPACCNVLML